MKKEQYFLQVEQQLRAQEMSVDQQAYCFAEGLHFNGWEFHKNGADGSSYPEQDFGRVSLHLAGQLPAHGLAASSL